MIKTNTVLEVVKGERKYQLLMSNDSPLGECFDVLCEMRAQVLDVIKTHAENEKPKEPDIQPETHE